MGLETPGTVLVTGGGARIGRAISLDLGMRGWHVVVQYLHSDDGAQQVVEDIIKAGSKAIVLQADLSKPEAVQAIIPRATAELGPLKCLINNASVFENDDISSVDLTSWRAHMDVNLHAPLILTQAFAAQAVADGGNVINILDQRVWKLTPFFLSYTVSKAALWTLTQTLAMALAPGIRVNGVGPGPTLPSPRQTDAQFAQQCASTLLQRGASPEEICAAIQFILSTPSMTGQMIALDGGQHLAWQSPENSNGQE
ncbi:MAG TPA: SDR family oxidoreductase [Sneathiellales bacterium]|jgi:NAD(P)-dependent dehydrogenase (short-subunit alcohol dehydrogenase family)|nr:SDR family oxidoreductase [Sneathiellales bacterium]